MKANIYFILIKICSIFLLCFVIGCSDNQLKSQVTPKALINPKSDDINVLPCAIDTTAAKKEFADCDSYVAINGKLKLVRVVDIISTAELDRLRDTADSLAFAANDTSDYIPCLEIALALNSTYKKMELLYKPVFAIKNRDSTDLVHGGKWRFYDVVDNPYYYKFDSINGTLVKTYDSAGIKRYQDTMMFYNFNDKKFEKFNQSLNSTGDVRSLIFPFEEIDSLLSANGPTKSVKFVNTALTKQFSAMDSCIKHSILLSPDDLMPACEFTVDFSKSSRIKLKKTSFVLGGGISREYANLAHLCPPNCKRLVYKLN